MDPAGQVDNAVPITAGAMLRQAREASGLHIAALAVSLKVPVKKLEALETDRFDLLPDAVFVRALASSVCRTLKVDPAPVLARLPQNTAPRLAHNASGINTPFRAPSDGPGPSLWDQVSRPAALAVFALLLGAIVLVFLPDIKQQVLMAGSAPEAAATSAVPALPAMPPADAVVTVPPAESSSVAMGQGTTLAAPSAGSLPAASAPAAATATLAPPVTLAPSVALSTPTVASPTMVITPPANAAAPVAAASPALSATAAAGIVVFHAKVESWIEVRDARGAVPLRKTLAPGEAAGVNGALPMSVIVGKADSTQVQVRGKPLDLAPYARDNVARFEVK